MKRQRDVVFVPTLKEAHARRKVISKNRKGYSSVARTRGAAVTGEMKYFDTVLTAGALPASTNWTGTEFDPATILTLFAPTVGAGVNQRIGKSAKVLSIKIKGYINIASQADQTATDAAVMVRVLLYQDLQTNAAQAQGEQVMDGSAASAFQMINSFQNIDNFGRFRVLKDKRIILDNYAVTYDGTNIEQSGMIRQFKFTHKFKKPVVVRFNATNGGTIADIVDNSWHVIATSNTGGPAPTISYSCRVNFKE